MIRVRIQDYQSIRDSTFDVEGVTASVGDSDSGKSAGQRALRDLVIGAAGDAHLPPGAKFSVVTVEADGRTVERKKGRKDNSYSVDGEVRARVGREVPAEVLDVLGIREVTYGGRVSLLPQFRKQGHLFLLDESPADRAAVIGSLSGADVAFHAERDAKSEHGRVAESLKVARSTLGSAEADVAGFAWVEQAEVAARDAVAAQDRLDAAAASLALVESCKVEVVRLEAAVSDLVLGIPEDGKVEAAEAAVVLAWDVAEQLKGLEALAEAAKVAGEAVEAMESRMPPPLALEVAVGVLSRLENGVESLAALEEAAGAHRAAAAVLAGVEARMVPPGLLEAAEGLLEALGKVGEELRSIDGVVSVAEGARRSVEEAEEGLAEAMAEVGVLEEDLAELVPALKLCPLIAGPFKVGCLEAIAGGAA